MNEETLTQNLIFRMGVDLLKWGAEISRVEDTMRRLAAHYEIDDLEIYVITNGIFASFYDGGKPRGTKIGNIPYVNVDLNKLADVNELSREITAGKLEAKEAAARLEEIEKKQSDPAWRTVLAAGVGGAGFCYLLGADLMDCLAAFLCGIIIQGIGSFLEYKGLNISKSVAAIGGSLAATLLCVFFVLIGLANNLDYAVIGAIIPIIPGFAFINGVRDIVDGNYISGFVRLADALLTFFSLAIGVGLGVKLWSLI